MLPVKLYQEARKLFVYNRQMRLMNIPLDRIISVEPTRITGSFDRRGEEAVTYALKRHEGVLKRSGHLFKSPACQAAFSVIAIG